ncbi:hypothetical protein ACHAXT_006785 [Thalassiosira profunda]
MAAPDDYGLNAYLDIQAELGQWGESTVATPARSPGPKRRYDLSPPPEATAAADGDGDAGTEGGEPSPRFPPAAGRAPGEMVGVQTPEPPRGRPVAAPEEQLVHVAQEEEFMEAEVLMGDGADPYRPYHDALLAYLRSRERLSQVVGLEGDISMMQIDGEDDTSRAQTGLDEAEVRFLSSLAAICLSRGQQLPQDDSEEGGPSTHEGNLWDLLSSLRAAGVPSLFYGVDGGPLPELTLANDPATLSEASPAEALDACLGGAERNASLPLQRLHAALGWIEGCHGRTFDAALEREYERNDDPLLPPPRRRTMRPGTVEALSKQPKEQAAGAFHPDAPVLAPEDELDDARLLRACFMLIQAGRAGEATQLANDCGQPWLSASWTGGEPLSSDGNGNPTRMLWKSQCRKVGELMARQANAEVAAMEDTGHRDLYPSVAYEAAILSLLSDNADAALRNPAFRTWEDGVHAVLRAEAGIIEDDVLRVHNGARAEALEKSGGHFPHPGTEVGVDDADAPRGSDGDLALALGKLERSPVEDVRAGGGDPFRNGAASFLVGQEALREYIEECAALALEGDTDDAAEFLRFVMHLVLYVDTVLPDFCAQLALPPGMSASDGDTLSLKELLLLKYVACLSSRRELWSHVALYASLLSEENILDTYASFLIHVHSDRERWMTLKQARDLFPRGFDCYILRNVVRGLILAEAGEWSREPGEAGAPAGVAPADARRMRSIHWLCYYPEHRPDALVCSNMLLRRFLLSCPDNGAGAAGQDLYAPKVFVEKFLPNDLVEVARDESQKEGEAVAGSISFSMVQNLEAEYLSIKNYLRGHTKYVQFLDAIAQTSPCHQSTKLGERSTSEQETEIAAKMERNAFRSKKAELCKLIVSSAGKAADALMEVLTFAGGWLVDVNTDLDGAEMETDEAKARSEELAAIRSKLVPAAVFMLQEVLHKTALWLEQVAYDTIDQFSGASDDMLAALFGSFDETHGANDELTADLLTASQAAPGYWHKKSLGLASIVANDLHALHEAFDDTEMESFLSLMAESKVKGELAQSLISI